MRAVIRRYWPPLLLALATLGAMIYAYLTMHQIFPDTQYYLGWTYRIMGYSNPESSRMVHQYVAEHGTFAPYPDIWAWFTGTKITQPRQLLPLLSVPFVWAFGPGGIVVVPGIAFGAAVLLMYRFASSAGRPFALAAAVLPLLTTVVLGWSVGGLTDSLGLLLHVGLLLLLPWRGSIRWPAVLGIVAVVAVSGAARFLVPFTVASVGALWLWAMWRHPGRRWPWTVAAAAAGVGEVAALLWIRAMSAPLTPRSEIYRALGSRRRDGQGLRGWYEEHLLGVLGTEARTALTDPALLVLIVLAVAGCIVCWRSAAPALVLAALAGSVGIIIANPVPTGFRYEIPVLPALVFASALFLRWAWDRGRGRVAGHARGMSTSDRDEEHRRSADVGSPVLSGLRSSGDDQGDQNKPNADRVGTGPERA